MRIDACTSKVPVAGFNIFKMEATNNNFQEKVIEQSKDRLIVVDFWAEWCGPCQMLAPILKKVTDSYGNKVALVKVDIDENHEKATEYQINVIPALRMFKNGKMVGSFDGFRPEEELKKQIDNLL